MNLWDLFFMSFFTQNVILTRFLGICPFMGTTKSTKNSFQMSCAVTIVVMLSSVFTYFLYHYVLIPTNTTYLKTILFILVIACFVQALDLLIKKYFPKVHESFGLYLPLITTNCAVLGIVLLNISNDYSFMETLVFSFGSCLGFTAVGYLFSSIREYLDTRNIPRCMKGYPIAFVTASIMAFLFSKVAGL